MKVHWWLMMSRSQSRLLRFDHSACFHNHLFLQNPNSAVDKPTFSLGRCTAWNRSVKETKLTNSFITKQLMESWWYDAYYTHYIINEHELWLTKLENQILLNNNNGFFGIKLHIVEKCCILYFCKNCVTRYFHVAEFNGHKMIRIAEGHSRKWCNE